MKKVFLFVQIIGSNSVKIFVTFEGITCSCECTVFLLYAGDILEYMGTSNMPANTRGGWLTSDYMHQFIDYTIQWNPECIIPTKVYN